LALCFNYGGYQEITDAVKKVMDSGVKPNELTEEDIAKNLYHPEVPPVDFMIRTSGEMRLSNFMLWRMAYAELYFSDKFWPDFDTIELDSALAEYTKRNRRFGGN
jgi:undecaprenyl diphosphate synthase